MIVTAVYTLYQNRLVIKFRCEKLLSRVILVVIASSISNIYQRKSISFLTSACML